MPHQKTHIGANTLSRFWQAIAVAVFATIVIGCAGKVQSSESFIADEPIAISIRAVDVSAGDLAVGEFDVRGLRPAIETALKNADLWSSSGEHSIEVELTDARFRTAGAAMMFGFMAGNDQVDSIVRLKDDRQTLKEFRIRAKYGFGGLVGGQGNVRSSWFHNKLADLIVDELEETRR